MYNSFSDALFRTVCQAHNPDRPGSEKRLQFGKTGLTFLQVHGTGGKLFAVTKLIGTVRKYNEICKTNNPHELLNKISFLLFLQQCGCKAHSPSLCPYRAGLPYNSGWQSFFCKCPEGTSRYCDNHLQQTRFKGSIFS